MADTTTPPVTPTADDCYNVLIEIRDSVKNVQEAQVFIVAALVQIKQALGGQ